MSTDCGTQKDCEKRQTFPPKCLRQNGRRWLAERRRRKIRKWHHGSTKFRFDELMILTLLTFDVKFDLTTVKVEHSSGSIQTYYSVCRMCHLGNIYMDILSIYIYIYIFISGDGDPMVMSYFQTARQPVRSGTNRARVQKSGSTTAQIDVSTRVIHFKLRSFLRSGKMELNKRPRYCLSGQTQSRLKFIIQSAFLCVCLSE